MNTFPPLKEHPSEDGFVLGKECVVSSFLSCCLVKGFFFFLVPKKFFNKFCVM